MKKNKRIMTIIILSTMVFVLAACNKEEVKKEKAQNKPVVTKKIHDTKTTDSITQISEIGEKEWMDVAIGSNYSLTDISNDKEWKEKSSGISLQLLDDNKIFVSKLSNDQMAYGRIFDVKFDEKTSVFSFLNEKLVVSKDHLNKAFSKKKGQFVQVDESKSASLLSPLKINNKKYYISNSKDVEKNYKQVDFKSKFYKLSDNLIRESINGEKSHTFIKYAKK